MSDISNQLIKDSYNYVLQSDLATGVVYRIGGTIPVNPIFQSGLTVNSGFTYSNGTEQPGYALLTDGTGYSYWGPVSGVSPSSGVTSISASTGLSASSSTGAVTIINTSPDQTVTISGGTGITTGGTYPNFTITNTLPDQTVTITGGTNIQIAGTYPNFGVIFTGTTGLNYFVSGSTPTATQSGDRWLNTNTGDELVWVDDGDSQQWIQISSIVGGGGGSSTSTATTFIASSNCAILSDANTYIGYSKAGWSYYAWDTTDSSFGYDSANCGIPISENIVEGQTINVCGVAYSAGLGSEGLRLYIYKLSCSDLSTINNVYTSSNEIFDSNGNLCFSFDYLVGSGEDFIKCSDFIVLGFKAGGITGNNVKISYKITAS